MMYALLADAIVVLHSLYAGFAAGGEIAILLGALLRWRWVRNLPFRLCHLAAVLIVAAEALAGAWCPLTLWEYRLRELAGQHVEEQISFIGRLVRSVLFYDFPPWVFTLTYAAFAVLVAATLLLAPPRRRPDRPRS